MMKKLLFVLSLLCCTTAYAQLTTGKSPVGFLVGDSIIRIKGVATQTEVKPGFRFTDRYRAFSKTTKGKTVRYLWGATSRQPLDSKRPRFYIDPGESQVIDFAIIRLDKKREYRTMPNPELRKCPFQTLDLFYADVKLMDDDNYLVTPKEPLKGGEYILVQLSQQPINKEGDLIVYPFTIDDIPAYDFYRQNY